MKKFMTVSQIVIAAAITIICILGILAQQLWPCIVIDEKTIFLIALGTLPWLPIFFKKFKLPGFEGEAYDRVQSKTDNPPPPPTTTTPWSDEMLKISADGKKILSTLWKYQKMYFKGDYSKRWTFLIHPTSKEYSNYVSGLAELLKLEVVTVAPDTNQVLLTNEGIGLIEENPDIVDIEDVYKF